MDTLFIGQNLITLDVVGSTNNHASKLISQGRQIDGTVIWAHEQNQGRGQRGNSWQSTPFQNLTFSIVLHPNFVDPACQFSLSQAISLGLRDYLQTLTPLQVSVKWPNDILIENRKVAGILLENTLKGNVMETLVVGIGLNVNQSVFDGLPNATSMRMETGVTYLLQDVMQGVCKSIEVRYLQLRKGEFEKLDIDYHKNLFLHQQWHKYKHNGQLIDGRIQRVQASGMLVVEKMGGQMVVCDLKELDFNL